MRLRLKILLAILIVAAVTQAAVINHLLATLGVLREREWLTQERVALGTEVAQATQRLSDMQARLCYAYKRALHTTIKSMGLDRPSSPILRLLADYNDVVPGLWRSTTSIGGPID